MRFVRSDAEQSYGRDYQQFVRCRFCGFINDTRKKSFGGQGEGYTLCDHSTFGGYPERYLTPNLINWTLTESLSVRDYVLMKTDADGNNATTKCTPRVQQNASGCAFCGSKNYAD